MQRLRLGIFLLISLASSLLPTTTHAQSAQLFQKAPPQLQADIDTNSFALHFSPTHTALIALLQQRTLNPTQNTRLGLVYLARHDAQGNLLWPHDQLPPGWYRLLLQPQPDSSFTVRLENTTGHQASFPATLEAVPPPSPDDAALQVGIAASPNGLTFWVRLSPYQQLRFHIPWASSPQPASEVDPLEGILQTALLEALQELRQLGSPLDSSRLVVASSDNVVLAAALTPGLDPLSLEQLQQGLSFAVFLAARKFPGHQRGEAVRFHLQRLDSARYVLRRLDLLGKTIAADTLRPAPQRQPFRLQFALALGQPPEVCLAVPEGALCFFWPLTAAIPQEIAAVPGDGSVVLTW
ncbi:hypothetical protein, partial [Rhodothermus profundi]